MKKLRLLLSAGAMLGLASGAGNAAELLGLQPPTTANPVTGVGMSTDSTGFTEPGSAYTGSQGLEAGGEGSMPFSTPAPGTINTRVNLFVNEFPMAAWWTGMNGTGTPASNAGNKQQAYGIYGWIRLDFGIDGMTKNGIIYGGFVEIRENNTTAVTGGTTPLASGPGVTSAATGVTSGFAQTASADSSDNTLYVRHAEIYLGTPTLGVVRVGTGFSAQTLYETGLFDDFDVGGWISFASTNIPSNMAPIWPWADEGGEYMAARIGYLSPVIAGFDGGVFFAPNNSGPFDGSGCSGAFGGSGCATQSSSQATGDITRYRNELGLALRYRNAFGPVGFAINGTWTTSGRINNVATTPPLGVQKYNGENIGDIGAEVSINKQLAIGGNVMFGAFNGNWSLQPKPTGLQTDTTQAVAWEAGVKYTFLPFPLTIGTYYFNYKSQGQAGIPTQRTDQGLDVGAVYGLGPGASLIAEYAWGQRYQGDYDFLTGETGTSANNKVQAQVATVGMSLRF